MGEPSEDSTASARDQPPPVAPSLDGQTLLLVCGSSPVRHVDGPLIPLDLAWLSEGLAAPHARQPFLQVHTATLLPWGLAGAPGCLLPLLFQGAPPGERQEVPDSRPPPAPSAAAHPSWRCHQTRSPVLSPHQGSPRTSDHARPMEGSNDPGKDTWNKGGGAPAGGAGHREARASGRIEGALGGECQPGQEGCEDLSLGGGLRSPGGVWDESVTLETQATACCPWLWRECPAPRWQGEASTEEPESRSRQRRVEGLGWGLPGGLSSEEEEAAPPASSARARGTSEARPAGGQLPAGNCRAPGGRVPGKEDSWPARGHALLSPGGSPGVRQGEEEEKELCQEASSLGGGGVPPGLHSKQCQGKETLSPGAGRGSPQSPRLAGSGEDPGRPRAPSTGQRRYSLRSEALGRGAEAGFQPSTLDLGSRAHQREVALWAGESWSSAQRRQSGGEESRAGPSLEQTVALDTGRALPGTRSPGQEEASRALDRARATFHELLSSLKKERSQVLCDRAVPREDQERRRPKARHLETEGARPAAQVRQLRQANRALEGDLAHLRRELDRYAQAISDLEECNGESYGKISELEEENARLKRDLGRLRKAVSQRTRRPRGSAELATLGDSELQALISELGVSCKELMRDAVLGLEGAIRACKGAKGHLLRRVRALEQEVALQTSGDSVRSRGGGQQPQESTRVAVDEACTMDKERQATPLLGQPVTSPYGPPLEEAAGIPGGQVGPASDLQDPGCGAGPTTAPLAWRNADIPSVPRGVGEAGGEAAHLGREETRPWCSHPGRALRTPSSSPQPQHAGAEASGEDPRLCVQRLRHQVQTLQCQLRDQGWAHRELQAAQEEALRLQEELKGKLEDLQREQHEARVAVAPLKAKLASLVHKCRERDRLITRLLRELGQRGPTDPLLSELAHNMAHDVALSEYAAAFLTPGLPETSHLLDVGSQGTAAARAREHLLSSGLDRVLQSPSCSESWPVPEAEWPVQTAQLDSPKTAPSLSAAMPRCQVPRARAW